MVHGVGQAAVVLVTVCERRYRAVRSGSTATLVYSIRTTTPNTRRCPHYAGLFSLIIVLDLSVRFVSASLRLLLPAQLHGSIHLPRIIPLKDCVEGLSIQAGSAFVYISGCAHQSAWCTSE